MAELESAEKAALYYGNVVESLRDKALGPLAAEELYFLEQELFLAEDRVRRAKKALELQAPTV